jgi:pteridine reductase
MTRKTALVTAGTRRIGAEIARVLHARGYDLLLHFRSDAASAELFATELEAIRPNSVRLMQTDLRDQAGRERLVSQCLAQFGRLDVLVNNASSFYPTPLGTISEADWDDLFGSNLKAPLFLSQAAAPALRRARGCIVNIVDIHAERPMAGFLAYSTAKAGLAGLTRALARELAPEVRVNGVSPGPILWPDRADFGASAREEILSRTPLQRSGSPGDIAKAVGFFVGDAPYITGQILAADGGRSVFV